MYMYKEDQRDKLCAAIPIRLHTKRVGGGGERGRRGRGGGREASMKAEWLY